jgi:hypothetical protein
MTDFPPEPPPSWRGMRDRIEAALLELDPFDQSELRIRNEHQRRTVAGILRKAFAPQLDQLRTQDETLDRIRKLVRRHRHDDTIPKRELEAALYGDEER